MVCKAQGIHQARKDLWSYRSLGHLGCQLQTRFLFWLFGAFLKNTNLQKSDELKSHWIFPSLMWSFWVPSRWSIDFTQRASLCLFLSIGTRLAALLGVENGGQLGVAYLKEIFVEHVESKSLMFLNAPGWFGICCFSPRYLFFRLFKRGRLRKIIFGKGFKTCASRGSDATFHQVRFRLLNAKLRFHQMDIIQGLRSLVEPSQRLLPMNWVT